MTCPHHSGRRPKVSVIIPHYQDFARLDLCLDALSRQTFPQSDTEVIVADNASPVGEAAVAATIAGRAQLVIVQERGAGPARNGAVALASGEILAFTDSDCLPSPDWLAEGLAALTAYDFVGGKVVVSVDNEQQLTPTEAFERVFAFNFKDYIERKSFTGSGNLFVARSIFDDVGGFRATVSEDVDWSHRAVAKGYRLGYSPGAVIAHPARRTWAELRDKWRRIHRESFALARGRPRGRSRWLAKTLLLPISAVAHAPKALFSKRLKSRRERSGALAILFRLRLWRFVDGLHLMTGK